MSASDAASGWKNGSARSFVLIVTTAGIVATRDPQDGGVVAGPIADAIVEYRKVGYSQADIMDRRPILPMTTPRL
jgi:hypothetical protein